MAALELILMLLAASAGLRLLADFLRVPYVSLLVVGGALLALVPGLPAVDLPPDVLFLIFVPPLLYWGAVSYPLRDFRRQLGPITRLAVLMVLVSMVVVAVVVHAWDSAFTWPAAFALGAIVSPPDPVAVLSMLRGVRLPRAIVSILEGEGLFNDVTALIAYRVTVAAAVTGQFVAWQAAKEFVFSAVVGVAIGLLVGVVIVRAQRLAGSVSLVENTISLLAPFASYLAAERLGASGVLSVAATGMYVGRVFPRFVRAHARVQATALWNVVTFLLESLIFILVGLELRQIGPIFDRYPFTAMLREAALVTLVLVLVRLLWIIPSAYVGGAAGRLLTKDRSPLPRWQFVAFVGWAGLRGGDSLVIALALPLATASGAPFPAREQIIFVTFAFILFTLVVQGPTLSGVARVLGLHEDGAERAEEAHARLAAVEAGLGVLSASPADTSHPEVVRYLKQRQRQRARRWAAREAQQQEAAEALDAGAPGAPGQPHEHFVPAPSHEAGALDEERAAEYRRIRNDMIRAEHRSIIELRDRGTIGDDVMRRIQRDLDFESMMLDTQDPVTEAPSEVPAAIDATIGPD
jgi:CPA1 family monovalent cation:H+ antiporter